MQFNVGDRVRVITHGGGLFNHSNAQAEGTIQCQRCADTVYVRFDNGSLDYGLNTDLVAVEAPKPAATTVKEKLEQIEKLVAEIKEILY